MKAKFSIKEISAGEEKEPFEMESEEGDQVHLGDQSNFEVTTVADGSVMLHAEGVAIKEEGQVPDSPEEIDIHLSQGEEVELAEGNSSWKVSLVSTSE
jgi:hypothetical protein